MGRPLAFPPRREPLRHACQVQHVHRCVDCGRQGECCSPECEGLVDGHCIGLRGCR